MERRKRVEVKITDEEIRAQIDRSFGKGYKTKVIEIDRGRKGLVLAYYKVKALRDGTTEWRIKGISAAMSGWDFPYRRKF